MLDSIVGVVRKLTEVGLAVVALAVVLQVIFGSNAAFLPGDVVGNVTGIVAALGANGLVGLAAVAVLYSIFKRN
ncbi:MAG TPA: hypothetical protein DIU35_04420 [Candidatus Latescibacteria bacterium]|nr:hypothetical protein [Candidatus Latescibacterota bacterium]